MEFVKLNIISTKKAFYHGKEMYRLVLLFYDPYKLVFLVRHFFSFFSSLTRNNLIKE